ncbi:hypothetical protein [Microbacterium sp. p3-SID131]|uniref:hypothetical protein n=1 Tax=Microbacterium sp. p3-SID131 TaxID=2916215 RepID=UPI0021A4C9EF|nr:hypothetical protein [Microbacterium sp. p3-SID131]MCT1363941.1 hypothetical protein [Microbacterium sp. p3-SID131]
MSAARILTVRQPWAWAIIHGGKGVENRVRNIAGGYRGPVLIHVAKAYADDWQSEVLADLMNRHPGVHDEPQPWRDDVGAIIGVADLVDVHRPLWDNTCDGDAVCSPWGEVDGWPYHLVFENPRALVEPIPYRGALGLRKTEFFISGDWLGEYVEPDPKHGMCTPYGCPPSCYSAPVGRLVATS